MGNKKHMKTLRVYGDSFAAGEWGGAPYGIMGWVKMLGDLLSLQIQNNSISGSSTEYAISTFVKEFNRGLIADDDIIIFVTSSTGRLYFSHQFNVDPSTASKYLCEPQYTAPHDWYWKNKDHIEWWMVNNDRAMQCITFESYIQLLKNFAISKPQCTVIILPAYNNGYYNQDIFNAIPPANFLRANIFLKNISDAEIVTNDTEHFDQNWWREFTSIDSRANHLTNPNLSILANLLVESIQTSSTDNITYDKFQTKNIEKIKSKEQYLKYVSSDLIPYLKYIENNLK
jgi:hypothetical protein